MKQLTPSVLQAPQLGAIRSTTAAMNGFEPAYVRGGDPNNNAVPDANLSHDDRTVLRVRIGANYPFVAEADAQRRIEKIIAGRKKAGHGWGYEPFAVAGFKAQLQSLNRQGMPKAV